MSICPQTNKQHDQERNAAANFPEVLFREVRIDDSGKIHAVIGGKEGEGKEDDGDAGQDEDGPVLAVGADGELVLLDGAQLEEL